MDNCPQRQIQQIKNKQMKTNKQTTTAAKLGRAFKAAQYLFLISFFIYLFVNIIIANI